MYSTDSGCYAIYVFAYTVGDFIFRLNQVLN